MSVNITATRRRSNATTTTRSSQRRHGRANPAEQRASSSLPAKRGSPQLGSACTSQARHANSRDKGTPARARKCPRVPDVCKVGKGKRHLQGFPRKPSDGLEPSTPSLPSSANRAKWGAAYASRGVARVVSDVSVLCPRAVVRLGNSLGAFVRRPTSGVTGWPCCFRSGRYWDALSRCESDGEHNFAARAPGAEILHRLCSLAQWERPVDDGRDLPLLTIGGRGRARAITSFPANLPFAACLSYPRMPRVPSVMHPSRTRDSTRCLFAKQSEGERGTGDQRPADYEWASEVGWDE
jgi:hypothetical protein